MVGLGPLAPDRHADAARPLRLAAASLVVSGLELSWIPSSQRLLVGVILVAFPAVLPLTAAVPCFLARDGAAASALCVLATTWLSIGAVFILSRPGSTSGALGLLLLVSAAGLGLSAAAGRSPSSSSWRCCWWPGCASR